ncbi:MAG: ribonuclease P protein component [Flavobacteriaceae bacterium]|nr:ribonuclease P protein component [Bacteroidia bacterium]NNK86945.1 ribonuclease P protein component [Flavobacteriaceae bacterium]
MRARYRKKDKLKSRKVIEKLFRQGKALTVFPLRLIFLPADFDDDSKIKAGFSVSSRVFKKAVDRNRIKRLMRESYRLNKNDHFNNFTTSCALMILYIGNTEPTFEQIDKTMIAVLSKLDDALAPKKLKP